MQPQLQNNLLVLPERSVSFAECLGALGNKRLNEVRDTKKFKTPWNQLVEKADDPTSERRVLLVEYELNKFMQSGLIDGDESLGIQKKNPGSIVPKNLNEFLEVVFQIKGVKDSKFV
jgi:hypothetical protein